MLPEQQQHQVLWTTPGTRNGERPHRVPGGSQHRRCANIHTHQKRGNGTGRALVSLGCEVLLIKSLLSTALSFMSRFHCHKGGMGWSEGTATCNRKTQEIDAEEFLQLNSKIPHSFIKTCQRNA